MEYNDSPIIGQRPGQRVRTINLQVEAVNDGLRLSSPLARGWAGHARTARELAAVVEQAFREVACASYARFKGAPYDLDVLTTHVPGDSLADQPQRRIRGPRNSGHKAYPVENWTKMEDGSWRSPGGRNYRADSAIAQNVVAKREAKGLPT